MKILKTTIFIIACGLLLSSTNSITQNRDSNKESWLYNKKGQLIADTSLTMDSSMVNSYRGRRCYSYLLDHISFPMHWVESGCCDLSMILKLSLKRDSSDRQFHIVTDIELISSSGSCTDVLFEANEKSLEGARIRMDLSKDNCYIHLPIKYKCEIVDEADYIPTIHKTMKNGYFIITTRGYSTISR